MPYGSVLIVDDVETNIYVARGLMTPYKLNIDSARDGFEAVEKIQSGKVYDVIFMDHMMPEMDGIEATKHIRDLGYINPIIALTANAIAGQADVFMQNGFDAFISKPIDVHQLDIVLSELLSDRQSRLSSDISSKQAETTKVQSESLSQQAGKTDVQEEPGPLTATVDGLDMSKGIKQHGGDRKAYLTVLRSYAADARDLLEKIENVNEKNIDEYKLAVHNLKGASRSLFAEHVGELAGDLENAAIENNLEYIEKNNAVFLETAWRLIYEINTFFSVMEAESPKSVKDKPDKAMLKELLIACKRYDMNKADEIMDQIDEYRYDSDDGLSLWLRNNIDVMNYKEIDARLSEVLNR